MLKKIGELLKQRRVWVSILSVISVILKIFGVDIDQDTEAVIIDQGVLLASLIPDVVNAFLALWSYFKPKE